MRQLSLELFCWEVDFSSSKFNVCLKRSAQLPSCTSDRAFGLRLFCPPCCKMPKGWTFVLSLFHTSFCDTQQLEPLDNRFPIFLAANPYLFLGILVSSLDRVSFHTYLHESTDHLLPIFGFFMCVMSEASWRKKIQYQCWSS